MADDINIVIEENNSAFPSPADIFIGRMVAFIPSDNQAVTITFVSGNGGNPFGWRNDTKSESAGEKVKGTVVRAATGEYEYVASSNGGASGKRYKLIVQ